jgi:hypothetical protein
MLTARWRRQDMGFLLLPISLGSDERLSPAAKRGAFFLCRWHEHKHAARQL